MSLNIVNQTTGDLTPIAGNATDKVGDLSALTTTDKSSAVAAINEVNGGLIGVTPIKIDGRTPANQGFAGFNTSGLDLTNRYPIAFYIVSSTEQTPYMVAQGSLEGISVGFDPTTHNPNLYVHGTADADWKDTDCFVIYA